MFGGDTHSPLLTFPHGETSIALPFLASPPLPEAEE